MRQGTQIEARKILFGYKEKSLHDETCGALGWGPEGWGTSDLEDFQNSVGHGFAVSPVWSSRWV